MPVLRAEPMNHSMKAVVAGKFRTPKVVRVCAHPAHRQSQQIRERERRILDGHHLEKLWIKVFRKESPRDGLATAEFTREHSEEHCLLASEEFQSAQRLFILPAMKEKTR